MPKENILEKYSISLSKEEIESIKNTHNINKIKGISFSFLDEKFEMNLDLNAFSDASKSKVEKIVHYIASNYKNKNGIELICFVINTELYKNDTLINYNNKFLELFSGKEKQRQQKIEALGKQVESFMSQISNLTSEKEVLEKKDKVSQATIAGLAEKDSHLDAQLLSLIQNKASLESENERLKKEKTESDKNFQSIQEKNLNLTTEKASLTSENQELKKEKTESDKKFKIIQAKIDKLRNENQLFSSNNSKLSEQIKEIQASECLIKGVNGVLVNGSKHHTEELTASLEKAQNDLKAQLEKTATLEEDKAKNLTEIAELKDDVAAQAKEIERLQRDLTNLNEKQTNFVNKCLGLSLGTGLGLSLSATGTLTALALATALFSPLGPTVVIGLIAGSALFSTAMLIGAIYLAVRKSATQNMRIALGGGLGSGVSLGAAGALTTLALTTALLSPLAPSIVIGLIAGSATLGLLMLLGTAVLTRQKTQQASVEDSTLLQSASDQTPLSRQNSSSSSTAQSSTRLNSGMVLSLLSSLDCFGWFTKDKSENQVDSSLDSLQNSMSLS